jgi:hypothetical protein
LYEHLPAQEVLAIAECFEFISTPKSSSWLNTVEFEFSVLVRQSLDRRIASVERLRPEVLALFQEQSAKFTQARQYHYIRGHRVLWLVPRRATAQAQRDHPARSSISHA